MVNHAKVERMPLLTDEERALLEGIGHRIGYPRGSILFGEDEETDFALLITKGHVKVTSGSSDRIVAVRGPGETVGEMAALEEQPRSASVYAMVEVEALYLPAQTWLRFLYDHPRAMHALLLSVSGRVREATRKQAESGYLGLEQRFARGLVELAGKIGEPVEGGVAIGLSQQELAGFVNTSRESVSQVIRTFRMRDLVSTGRQKMVLRDLEVLGKIAAGELTASH